MIASRMAALFFGTAVGLLDLEEGWAIYGDHLSSPWPEHARWHAALGGLLLGTLAVVIRILLWVPFRRGEPGAELPLPVALLATPLAVLGAALAVPGGAPGSTDIALALGGLLVFGITVTFVWRSYRATDAGPRTRA